MNSVVIFLAYRWNQRTIRYWFLASASTVIRVFLSPSNVQHHRSRLLDLILPPEISHPYSNLSRSVSCFFSKSVSFKTPVFHRDQLFCPRFRFDWHDTNSERLLGPVRPASAGLHSRFQESSLHDGNRLVSPVYESVCV